MRLSEKQKKNEMKVSSIKSDQNNKNSGGKSQKKHSKANALLVLQTKPGQSNSSLLYMAVKPGKD